MKPYILDDASTLEHQRLDLMSKVRDRVVGSGWLDAATLDAASALLEDSNYWTQCWMMTAVWVRKSLG